MPVQFVIYDELPQFNFAELIENNLIAHVNRLNHVDPERLLIGEVGKAVKEDEEFRKKTTILHMLEKEKSDWLPKNELWHAERVVDLKPPAPPGIDQHFWGPGYHLPDMFYAAGRRNPRRDNGVNFFRYMVADAPAEARAVRWVNPNPDPEDNPWRNIRAQIQRIRDMERDRDQAARIREAYDHVLAFQMRPMNFFGVRARGAPIENGSGPVVRYSEVNIPVTYGFRGWATALSDERVKQITIHVRDGGLPCLCDLCVTERTKVAEEDCFSTRAGSQLDLIRPPKCRCYHHVAYGNDGMEGCLKHDDEGFTQIEGRASSLLRELLTPHQRACWGLLDYIPVRGSEGTIYRIYRMPTYNVLNTRTMTWLCTLPQSERWGGGTEMFPPSDGRIAQILMLTTNEKTFEALANHSPMCTHPDRWVPPDLITPNPLRNEGAIPVEIPQTHIRTLRAW